MRMLDIDVAHTLGEHITEAQFTLLGYEIDTALAHAVFPVAFFPQRLSPYIKRSMVLHADHIHRMMGATCPLTSSFVNQGRSKEEACISYLAKAVAAVIHGFTNPKGSTRTDVSMALNRLRSEEAIYLDDLTLADCGQLEHAIALFAICQTLGREKLFKRNSAVLEGLDGLSPNYGLQLAVLLELQMFESGAEVPSVAGAPLKLEAGTGCLMDAYFANLISPDRRDAWISGRRMDTCPAMPVGCRVVQNPVAAWVCARLCEYADRPEILLTEAVKDRLARSPTKVKSAIVSALSAQIEADHLPDPGLIELMARTFDARDFGDIEPIYREGLARVSFKEGRESAAAGTETPVQIARPIRGSI